MIHYILFIPSAFSPGNGDGLNDRLYLYGNGIKKMSLIVFNRWGEKVFESDHVTMGWDGIYKNEPQPSGVYSFSAEDKYLNGEQRMEKRKYYDDSIISVNKLSIKQAAEGKILRLLCLIV